MKLFDYLFINLYTYYKENNNKIKWSSPESYSVYLLAIGILLWLVLVEFIIAIYIIHSSKFQLLYLCPLLIFFFFNNLLEKKYITSLKYQVLYAAYQSVAKKRKTTGRLITLAYLRIPLVFITILLIVH